MADTRHVMISYNWGHKEEAMQIANILKKHGKTIWMDVEGGIQQGDVNKSMAEGVEKAYAIVFLVSKKYQDSKNCRRELSYADIKNVPMFPCKVEPGYEGDDWLGIMTAGLLYFDFRGDKAAAESSLVDAIQSVSKEANIKILNKNDDMARQKEIFNRDFRGRVYQKEGPYPVQYGFESFDNVWVDWSHYYYDKTCTRKDGTFMSSQELKRRKFGDAQFVCDRTFVGTMYWDDPEFWSTKSGPNSMWKYFIKLSEDLSRVESGKLMYVDANNDIIDYKYYGKRTFYYDAVDTTGTATSGEMSYILHEILPQKDVGVGEVSDSSKDKGAGVLDASGAGNSAGTVSIPRQEYEELKAYKQKYLDLKALLRIASAY